MKVVFRVDASPRIGTGHFARCLTLAALLHRRGAECLFICRHTIDSLSDAVRSQGHQLRRLGGGDSSQTSELVAAADWLGVLPEVDAKETAANIGEGCDWLVVDHYVLDARWESALRPYTNRIFVIDDIADREHDCDLLLDQNLFEDGPKRYANKVSSATKLLCGPQYALLRDEFAVARASLRQRTGIVKRILVFFGGIDADDFTGTAVRALAQLPRHSVEVDVIVGSGYRNREEIVDLCTQNSFRLHVQISHMAALMAAADLAIGAGGAATWERCCLGLPSLTFAVAANQQDVVHQAAEAGLIYAPVASAIDCELIVKHVRVLMENPRLLSSLSRASTSMVDGYGQQRVARNMGIFATQLRKATPNDSKMIFEWRNHESIRSVSRSTELIEWHTHERWFTAILVNANADLLIGEGSSGPMGVVRFDVNVETAEISIYLSPDALNLGQGSDLLGAAEFWLVQHRPKVSALVAEVKGDNVASHRLFKGAGYQSTNMLYTKRVNE